MARVAGDPRVMPIPHSGCWIWMGSLTKGGYPRRFSHSRDLRYVHRLSYEERNGPISEDICALHVTPLRA